MTEVSNEQIYGVLLQVKEDLGRTSATLESHAQILSAHVKQASVIEKRMDLVETARAHEAGVDATWRRVITGGVGLAGAVGGWLVQSFSRGHH